MKKIAIIPMLLGSTRIPDKNLLLVDGHPLVSYIIKACKESGVFDEIYINTEHDVFEKFAKLYDVKFYKRNPAHGGSACTMKNKSRSCNNDRCQTHDHFLYDFMKFIGDAELFLVHTTSPLLEGKTIANFVQTFEKENYDSAFSVEERHTETLYGNDPINFSLSKKIPTQSLQPLKQITWALTGWKTKSFIESYDRNNENENGPTFCGKIGYFPLNRVEALDADTWDDLRIIEAALLHKRERYQVGQFKIPDNFKSIEHELGSLMGRDGVGKFDPSSVNLRKRNINEIIEKMGKAPWCHFLFYTATDQTALICQQPGEGARKHAHYTHDEWWLVIDGTFEWRLEDGTKTVGNKGDLVFLPRGTIHHIVCTSKEPGIRLACGARDMEHFYF